MDEGSFDQIVASSVYQLAIFIIRVKNRWRHQWKVRWYLSTVGVGCIPWISDHINAWMNAWMNAWIDAWIDCCNNLTYDPLDTKYNIVHQLHNCMFHYHILLVLPFQHLDNRSQLDTLYNHSDFQHLSRFH